MFDLMVVLKSEGYCGRVSDKILNDFHELLHCGLVDTVGAMLLKVGSVACHRGHPFHKELLPEYPLWPRLGRLFIGCAPPKYAPTPNRYSMSYVAESFFR
jgi:hypothetical protein